jgi:hypothetical protein
MANFSSAQVGLSYPKARNVLTKVLPIARTDSSTVKCVLPKGAVIVGVHVNQTVDATTAAGAFNLGWTGATTGIINAFSMATTKVGLVNPGTAVGANVMTLLDSDKAIISSYTVGSSTAGGTGFVILEYFVASGGEGVDD